MRYWLKFLAAAIIGAQFMLAMVQAGAAQQSPLGQQAQKAMQRGTIAARQSEWALAIKYFEKAYRQAPAAPEVLYNLALAIDRSGGNSIRAMALYGGFLAAAPGSPRSAEIRRRLLELDVKTEAEALKLMRQAESAAVTLPEKYARESELEDIAEALTLSGNLEAAMALASLGDADDTYKRIAKAQAMLGDTAGALATVARIKDEYDISIAYQYAAQQLARLNKFSEAMGMAERTLRPGHKLEAFVSIAKQQSKGGRNEEALALLERAEALADKMKRKDAYDEYHDIAIARAKAGDFDGAERAAQKIDPAKDSYVGWAYDAIVEALLKAGDLKRAERLAGRLAKPGEARKDIAIAAIETGNWPVALNNLARIPKPGGDFFSALDRLNDRLKAADKPLERAVLERIQNSLNSLGATPMNGAVLVSLAGRYEDMGDTSTAIRLLAKASSFLQARRRDAYYDSAILAANKTLINAFSAAGRLSDARQHAGAITDPKIKAKAQVLAAREFARRGELKSGRALLNAALNQVADIKKPGDRYDVLEDMRDAYLALGERKNAQDVLTRMEKIIRDDTKSYNWRYRYIGGGWLRNGNAERALQLVPKLKDRSYQDYLLEDISQYFARKGNFKRARQIAGRISGYRKISALLRIEYDLRTVYRALGEARSLRGEIAAELATLQLESGARGEGQAYLAGRMADLYDLKAARRALEDGLRDLPQVGEAQKQASLLNDFAAKKARSLTLSHRIVQRLRQTASGLTGWAHDYYLKRAAYHAMELGETGEAASISELIEQPDGRAESLTDIAEKLAAYGANKQAAAFLDQALAEALTIDKPATRLSRLTPIGLARIKLGDRDGARHVLGLILEAQRSGTVGLPEWQKQRIIGLHIELGDEAGAYIDLWPDAAMRSKTRLMAADDLIKKKMPGKAATLLDEAVIAARRILTEPARSKRLAEIAVSYVKAGRLKTAADIIKKLPPYYAPTPYEQLARAYLKAGNGKLARGAARAALKAQEVYLAADSAAHSNAYGSIAALIIRTGDTATAAALVKRSSDNTAKIRILVELGRGLARQGETAKAMTWLRRAWQAAGDRKSGFADWANTEIALQHLYAKRMDAARQTARTIKTGYWTGQFQERLANHFLYRKPMELEAALREAEAIPEPGRRDHFAQEAVARLLKAPVDILAPITTALSIGDADTRDAALHAIAMVQAHGGDSAGALDTAGNMSQTGRFWTLRAVAMARFGAGNEAGARRTLEQALSMASSLTRQDERMAAIEAAGLTLKAWDETEPAPAAEADGAAKADKPATAFSDWAALLAEIGKTPSLSDMRAFLQTAGGKSARDMIGALLKAARERIAMARKISALAERMEMPAR